MQKQLCRNTAPKYYFESSPADVNYVCLCKVFQRNLTAIKALKITYHYDLKHSVITNKCKIYTSI